MGVILSPKWFRIALLNLAIVALYGTLMRYKIAFDFPFLSRKTFYTPTPILLLQDGLATCYTVDFFTCCTVYKFKSKAKIQNTYSA